MDIVASIFEVAGAGFRLSFILNAVNCEVANAPPEVHAISKNVTRFSLLLRQLASALEQQDSIHSKDALSTAERVLEESNHVFAEINTMLEKVRSQRQDGTVSPSVPQRIKWCFRKHSIQYLLGRIDRLQIAMTLMLQIFHLGSTMASTSRHDSPEKVKHSLERINRERVEAQDVAVLYFYENQQLDHLYLTAREEETEPLSPIAYHNSNPVSDALTLVTSPDSQVAKVDDLPPYTEQDISIPPPTRLLPDLDGSWQRVGDSPKEMLKASSEIINQLLERWTRWRELREREHRRPRSRERHRHKAAVAESNGDDDSNQAHRYEARDPGPGGRYLEGPTTDWRQPHSGEAKQKRAELRKAYAGYQASVEGGSDDESSPVSNGSKKKASKRHVINSDQDTSGSEQEKITARRIPRRRSSAIAVPSQQKVDLGEQQASRSYGSNFPQTPNHNPPAPQKRPTISPTWSQYQHQRPFASPDQNPAHHSFTSPVTPTYVSTSMPFAQAPGPHSPGHQPPPPGHTYPFPTVSPQQQRYVPRIPSQTSRLGQPPSRPGSRDGLQRPVSRDGRPAKSPSRLSQEYSLAEYKAYDVERKRHKKEMKKQLGDGAAKGLLAGGSLAVLLEALDVFS